MHSPFCAAPRWNEMKLRELREEEELARSSQRTSRLAKWRELAYEAAKENAAPLLNREVMIE